MRGIAVGEAKSQGTSHLITRSPRSRIRENSASPKAQESGADADNSQSNHRGILTNSATRLRFLLRRAGRVRASHLITRSPRSRIRENSASPSARKRCRCRQFAVELPRNSHEFRYEIEISVTESRRRRPATLSLVPLVAEFVRILPRRAQESGADADNSQSNHRGILTNSATRLRFLLRRAGRVDASHLITRSPRSRIRENSASPSARKRCRCRQFAGRTTAEFSRIPLQGLEISATESRARRRQPPYHSFPS